MKRKVKTLMTLWGGRGSWRVSVVVLTAVAGRAAADDGSYVMPDGRKIPLVRSTSELGVVLHHCDDAKACAERLSKAGVGRLEDLKLAPKARVKLLRVDENAPQVRVAARQDPAITEVRPVYRFQGSSTPVVGTGQAVVKVRPSLSKADRAKLWNDYPTAAVEELKDQRNVYQVTPLNEDGEVELAERLAADPRVLWAQPSFRQPTISRQVVPSDPFYNRQWHLNNTGQLGGTLDADIDAPEAWSIASGEGVLFGMFDQACDVDHEDLRDNYVGFGQDAALDEAADGHDDPRPKDIGDRHGTSVMGLAVAAGNARGGRGVAYGARFTATRGLNEFITDVQLARVYNFAREHDVDVHINSWGFIDTPNPAVVVDAIELAFTEGRNRGDLDDDGDDDPLGMVVVFASGNEGRRLQPGFELSMLPQVIGVGASNDHDVRSIYSSFGTGIDVLAPSNDFETQDILTTDNTDGPDVIDPGYNIGGFLFGVESIREADSEGKYTQFFGGTSAACPIAAGVAGLILATNSMLTATDVRLILEHTADRISPTDAAYNGVTGRSEEYGYGRINAGGGGDNKLGAVEAAQETLTNGGHTWPDRVADVRVEGVFLRWRQNFGTSDFLVVSGNTDFDFIPEDGACYDARQPNCTSEVRGLPGGAQVLAAGCSLSCDPTAPGLCATGAGQCAAFAPPAVGQDAFFAIYARNAIGRYSFGVAANSDGDVLDSGTVVGEGGGSGGAEPPPAGPAVTISVSPLQGASPLTVEFSGNAVSDIPVDENKTLWDFDTEDANPVDATTRNSTHTYVVAAGLTRTFVARLTMFDADGNAGYAEVNIRVEGPEVENEDTVGGGNLDIVVGLPGTPGSDVDAGVSPFSVVLSVDVSGLSGTLQSIAWDLGDGSRATSLVVPHTYVNDGDTALRFPINATITTVTTGGTTLSTSATRVITVQPGLPVVDPGDPDVPGAGAHGEGGAATPCGTVGMLPLSILLLSLTLLRRRN